MNKNNIFTTIILILVLSLVVGLSYKYTKKDINILIIGDSIAQSDGRNSEEGYWHCILQKSLKNDYCINANINLITKNGSKVSWGLEQYNMQVNTMSDYDVVFICFGQNDQYNNLETFRSNYSELIESIRQHNPDAKIYGIIESSIRTDNEFTETIKNLSNIYRFTYIDTRIAFANSSFLYDELTDDGIHPNDKGNKIYAKYILEILEGTFIR